MTAGAGGSIDRPGGRPSRPAAASRLRQSPITPGQIGSPARCKCGCAKIEDEAEAEDEVEPGPGSDLNYHITDTLRRRRRGLLLSRFLPLQDDIASTVFWRQTEPHADFPPLPALNALEVI
jgi:hypothetical protein